MTEEPNLTRPPRTCRAFLQRLSIGALGLAVTALVQGCGGASPTPTTASAVPGIAPAASAVPAASAAPSVSAAAGTTSQHRPVGRPQRRSLQRTGGQARRTTSHHPAQRCGTA